MAQRVGGLEAAGALARDRSGTQFDPVWLISSRGREMLLMGLDSVGAWDAVIDAEPSLAVLLTGDQIDGALLAIANFVDLSRLHARPRSRGGRACRGRLQRPWA